MLTDAMNAGYLSIEDVSGALRLATQAGLDARRISGSITPETARDLLRALGVT